MTKPMVHWDEGMFLRPHHFQAAQRYQLDLGARGAKWDYHYNWGLRNIDLDSEALANYRLVIRSVQARLRDYHSQTEPVLELFRKKRLVVVTDGTQAPEEVYHDIRRQLGLSPASGQPPHEALPAPVGCACGEFARIS